MTSRCASCASPLSCDQRYCVECGTRRGPLPHQIQRLIGIVLQRGHDLLPGPTEEPLLTAAEEPVPEPDEEPAPGEEPTPAEEEEPMPTGGFALIGGYTASPRAVAVAVMAMLAFGVIVGSLTRSQGLSLAAARRLLIAVERPSASPSAPADSGRGRGGGGGGGGSNAKGGGSGTSPAAPSASPAPSTPVAASPFTNPGGGAGATSFVGLPPIKHVFLIVLSSHGFSETFSPVSHDRYLSKTLANQGELLADYYAVTTGSLANEVALISGQGPTVQSTTDCPVFAAITPAATVGKYSQVTGAGCVYPASTPTLPNQLTAKHHTWKAYVEGIDSAPRHQAKTCRHPALGAADGDLVPRPHDPYVTWANPIVYFRSLTRGRSCAKLDVGLGRLATDLRSERTTPTLSYVVPSPCDDGSDTPCAKHAPAGLAAADKFLKQVVPEIRKSAAYKAGGLIAITFDHAPQAGLHLDASACCDNPVFPNLPAAPTPSPTTPTPTGATTTPASTIPTTTTPTTTPPATTTPTSTTPTPTTPTTTTPPTTVPNTSGGSTSPTGGGGQVGLLLISPYVKPGSTDVFDNFNHFALLGSLEKLFKLKPLGYAADPNLLLFDTSVYNINAP